MKKKLSENHNSKSSAGKPSVLSKKLRQKLFLPLLLIIVCFVLIGISGGGAAIFRGVKTSAAAPMPTATPESDVLSIRNQNNDNGDGKISQEAMAQIAALEQEKESRTPTQKKIDSRLLYTIKMERKERLANGIDALDTGLKPDDKGYLAVDITANVTDNLLKKLNNIKAEIIGSYPQYHSVTARVPLAEIESLAALEEVVFIQPKQEGMVNENSETRKMKPSFSKITTDQFSSLTDNSNRHPNFNKRAEKVRQYLSSNLTSNLIPSTGSVNSEGDVAHRSNVARIISGANGTGIKIGVLSDGVNSLAASQASGDLPATVTVLPGQAGNGDEGTAMLQIVYDVAPGAQLYYATAGPTSAQFAQNIKDLRTAGCDIIIDDFTYFYETPFQNGQAPTVMANTNGGIIVQAVNDVTVGSQAGALYFSSAANSGNKNDGTAGVWEGDFANGGGTTAPLPTGNNVHDFGGGATSNTLTFNGRVILKWSDPLGASGNDYDLYVLNSAGTAVTVSSSNIQSGTQDPLEDVGNRTTGEKIVIVQKAGAANRFLHLNTNRGTLAISTPGVVYGHNAGINTVSCAATPAGPAIYSVVIGPFPKSFSSTTNSVEIFSSDGPRRIFYNADSTPITPGNVSSTGGQLLQKPDITAADGVFTTAPGFNPFFGTSAAAPHAGALAALLKSASPAATRTQIYNAITSTAIDIEAPGVDRDSGAGIFMPIPALAALGVTGPAYLEAGTATATEAPGNGNGKLDPGESANLTVQLNNLGLSSATAVSATLSTSTAGVIITEATEVYPNLNAVNGTGTNSIPFSFTLANNFPCGAEINFTLTVSYAGGATSSQTVNFTVKTGGIAISTTLDTTAPPSGAGYTAITGTQTGRLARNGINSNCATVKATPAQQDSAVNRRYDAYTFTPSSSGCVTVTLSAPVNGALLYSVAYKGSYNPTSIQTNYLADPGTSVNGDNVYSFNAVAGQTFTIVVHEVAVGSGSGVNYTLKLDGAIAGVCSTLAPTTQAIADFDGDGRTDVSVFRPSEGNWYLNRSTGGFTAINWGASTDIIVPGDYDGDGKTDFAVFRPNANPSNPDFYILNSNTSTVRAVSWGLPGDVSVAGGDYDGDSKADVVVFRPSDQNWYILKSTGGLTITKFGFNNDSPFAGDFDGDGKTDLAVYRPGTSSVFSYRGTLNNSGNNTTNVFFGTTGDVAVPGDYDGDRRTDVAVFRPSNGAWYIQRSTGAINVTQFGLSTDIPVPGDYDGDGKTDIAVYRSGQWYLNGSLNGFTSVSFGLSTDKPVPNRYLP